MYEILEICKNSCGFGMMGVYMASNSCRNCTGRKVGNNQDMTQDLRLTLTQSVLTASAGVPACMVFARNLCLFFNDLY